MAAPIPDAIREQHIETIIEKVSEGMPLTQACKMVGIGVRTFHEWRERDPELSARMARAREYGFDEIAVNAMEIVDEIPPSGEKGYDSAAVAWAKNRAWVRLQLLAKWDPRRYGEKLAIGGAADLPPVQSNVTVDAAEAYKTLLGSGGDK